MTAPFSTAAPTWLADGPVQHEAGIVISGQTVPILAGTLTFNGTTLPTISGTITVPIVSTTTDLVAELDPRRGRPVEIHAGYVYPDGTRDIHRLAVVYSTSTEYDELGSVLTVELGSAEVLLSTQTVLYYAHTDWINRAGITEAVSGILGRLLPTASFLSDIPAGNSTWIFTDYEIRPGDEWLDILAELTQTAGYRLHVDRDGVWRLTNRIDVPSPSAGTTMATGPDGTITELTERVSLDEWANTVQILAEEAGVPDPGTMTLVASRTDGPTGIDNAPRRVVSIRNPRPLTAAAAQARANTLVSRYARLGSGHVINAVADYWINPDDTVAITRPGKSTVRQLVRNVTYDFHDGTMRLSTREDTTPIITAEEPTP